jgi:hypothetical protein
MADTLAANVSEITQELIDAVVMQMPQTAPMMNLVERKPIPDGKNSLEIPRANSTFSVENPTEGDDLVTTSQFDLTSTTISPTLRSIRLRISGRAQYFSQESILDLISQELSRAQGQDIDDDLTAEFVNFTDIVSVGGNLTVGNLRDARTQLMGNAVATGGPAPLPLYTVIDVNSAEDLMTNLGLQGTVPVGTATGQQFVSEGLSADFIRNYSVRGAIVVGVPVFWDGYIAAGSGISLAMFSREALQLAISRDWDFQTFEESEWIGVILRAVADYNSGIGKFNEWGIEINVNS